MNGIEKYIDDLGRVVIPIKFRDRLGMKCRARFLVNLKENAVCISLAEKYCILCGDVSEIVDEFRMCKKCIRKIKKAALDGL